MPTSLIHIGFNLGIYYFLSLISSIEFVLVNCLFLFAAELIDLDHLFSKPVYQTKRNSFKVHFFHRNWLPVLAVGTIGLFFYPILFFSIGLISHFSLDYFYVKYFLKLV